MKTFLNNIRRELLFSFTWVAIGWPGLYATLFILGSYMSWSRFIQYVFKEVPHVVNLLIFKFEVPLIPYGFTFSSWGQFFATSFVLVALQLYGWFSSRNKSTSEGVMSPTGFAMFWSASLLLFFLLMTAQVAGH